MGNNWKKKPLGSLCNGIGDGVHGTPKYVVDSPYSFINGNNLKDGRVDTSSAKKVDGDEYQKYFVELDETTLLMSINGTLGSLALYSGESVILGKSAAYIRCRDISREFCYYYFQLRETQRAFFNIATGSTIKNLSLDSIKNFQFPVPSLNEQNAIAAVLSALDAKIALNQRINAELEGMAKLLYDYWFVQYDFPLSAAQAAALGKPHLTGQPYRSSGGPMVFDPQLKREIPKGWVAKELSEIADITMGQSPPGHTYNNDRNGVLFFQGSTDFGWRYPSPRQYTTAPTRMAKKGDILLSVRAPVGTLNIAPEECAIGRGLSALRSKNGSSSFLFQVLQNLQQVFARRNGDGTTFGSINRDDLRSLQLAYPSEEEIVRSFDRIVSETDSLIFTNHQQNQELTTLRDWLLPMLMNRQVRVG